MQELRLVGVHEDGGHLLLSGEGSETYTLPIDEALRMAASQPSRRRPTALQGKESSAAMTPRDIQARIRAGATADEVAAESGLDMAHILRYEGPVRAERDYIAAQARKVEVSGPLPSHDGYRSAFGDNPATLGDMVTHRLRAFGIKSDDVEWDAWRGQEGSWEVVAHFDLPESPRMDVGENPPARWSFNPARKTVSNANRWAQVLSELEPLDGPLPQRRLSAVADRPFDFEADTTATAESPAPESSNESEDLLDALRSRRGQRLGADEEGDDALALMLAKGSIPAAHPREGSEPGSDDGIDSEENDANLKPERRNRFGSLSLAHNMHDNSGLPRLHDGVSSQTREIIIPAGPGSSIQRAEMDDGGTEGNRTTEDQTAADRKPNEAADRKLDETADRKAVKPKRSSVPSWDEIVFGTKGD